MVSKEFIEKAKKCTSKEELLELAKIENIELSDADINNFSASLNSNKKLSDEELDNVTGGTCYGDGWDGTERPIVTAGNCCALFRVVGGKSCASFDPECDNCIYYSDRVNGERISALSAWCTHPDRIKGHDIVNV